MTLNRKPTNAAWGASGVALRPAPPWDVVQWFNAPEGLTLAGLRGRVVVAGAFQMLCPGCVAQTIPQLQRAHTLFPAGEVAVIGLHTVFEHHQAMTPAALAAFLHEYRVAFPVGIDRPAESGDPIPSTMRRYGMQGTPTMLLVDRQGRLRRQTLGHVPDLQLGAEIASLMHEGVPIGSTDADEDGAGCSVDGCSVGEASVRRGLA